MTGDCHVQFGERLEGKFLWPTHLDIHIYPDTIDNVPTGRNQSDKHHLKLRKLFFDNLSEQISISDMFSIRDEDFDDAKFRSAGIRLNYESLFEVPVGVKEGILLEVGFDLTSPNETLDVDSWAYMKAVDIVPNLKNNKAAKIKCYNPEYTFVEKLQAITRKVRQQKESGEFQTNFLRHFYDIHMLFQEARVKHFIGSAEYNKHKKERFKGADNPTLKENLAFNLMNDHDLFKHYEQKFHGIRNLFISGVPKFEELYMSILAIGEIG